MKELIANLHIHTIYSDGSGSHAEIAQAASEEDIDIVITTDHNILVQGIEKYYGDDQNRVLLLTGEEVHDRTKQKEENHLLVLGAEEEMAGRAEDTQSLLNAVNQAEGLSFIAHPHDTAAPAVEEPDIPWVDWSVNGFTGIELWNGFSEFKSKLKNKALALFYAYFPDRIAQGPSPETITKWDQLLAEGKRVVAIGGSDAHARKESIGPLQRTIFPYHFHFKSVNTHLITPTLLKGDLISDKKMIYGALRAGHAFVGYDLLMPTRDFMFKGKSKYESVIMGDEVKTNNSVTLQISLPRRCESCLFKDGEKLQTWTNREVCVYTATEPGAYRVEAYIPYKGQRRGWIFSNPIYVRREA